MEPETCTETELSRLKGRRLPFRTRPISLPEAMLAMTTLCSLALLAFTAPSAAQDALGKAPMLATPSPYLNPLLIFENGSAVTTEAAWRERRAEVSRLSQEAFVGTYPTDVPKLLKHVVLNTTSAGDGVSCTFVELTFDTSGGGTTTHKTVSFPLEIIAPTDSATRPAFMTQWNHRQWALEGVARGYIGVVYPGSDAKDVAPQVFLHLKTGNFRSAPRNGLY